MPCLPSSVCYIFQVNSTTNNMDATLLGVGEEDIFRYRENNVCSVSVDGVECTVLLTASHPYNVTEIYHIDRGKDISVSDGFSQAAL